MTRFDIDVYFDGGTFDIPLDKWCNYEVNPQFTRKETVSGIYFGYQSYLNGKEYIKYRSFDDKRLQWRPGIVTLTLPAMRCVNGGPAISKFSNNEAEYKALYFALLDLYNDSIVREQPLPTMINIHGDSKLVIEQMKGNWEVRATNLVRLHKICNDHVLAINNLGSVVRFKHVLREVDLQSKVDAFARGGLRQSEPMLDIEETTLIRNQRHLDKLKEVKA